MFAPVCSPAFGIAYVEDLRANTWPHFAPIGSVSGIIDGIRWYPPAGLPDDAAGAGQVFSDETHVISAALGGVALMSLPLIGDALANGALVQPLGPVMEVQGFHLVYPQPRTGDSWIAEIREWILGLTLPGAA